jgi:hypothetical protein
VHVLTDHATPMNAQRLPSLASRPRRCHYWCILELTLPCLLVFSSYSVVASQSGMSAAADGKAEEESGLLGKAGLIGAGIAAIGAIGYVLYSYQKYSAELEGKKMTRPKPTFRGFRSAVSAGSSGGGELYDDKGLRRPTRKHASLPKVRPRAAHAQHTRSTRAAPCLVAC